MNSFLFLSLLVTLATHEVRAQKQKPPEKRDAIEFHYEDIRNFRRVLDVASQKGDTLQAIRKYFVDGSEGMRAWIDRYEVKPERILKAVRYFPGYYKYLSTLDSVLITYESQITEGLEGIKKLYPSKFVHIPPVYYFILFAGGGSVEMTANMISIDYFGLHDKIDRSEFDRVGGLFPEGSFPLARVEQVPLVAIHETAHLLQSYMQGETDYVSIYLDKDKSTILAYAIREGGADFLTYLGADILDAAKWAYVEEHEKELWEQMQPILDDHVDDHKGWFSGKSPENPDWPFQIGYYMGFKIVKYYYDNSDDKEDALHLILNSYKDEDFQKFAQKYSEKWQ